MKKDNELSGEVIVCYCCGKVEELHWDRTCNKELFDFKLCFTCNHWRGHFEADTRRDNAVIVKGVHYMIEPDETEPASGCRSFQTMLNS